MLRVGNLFVVASRRLGSIRSAGGSIGKREEAVEEEYFHKKRQEQLKNLKNKNLSEAEFVSDQIKEHQNAIEFHQRMIDEYKSGKKVEEIKMMNGKMD